MVQNSQASAIVIGAGIVGASCAVSLQRAGYSVQIVDPKPPGTGASYGNAGSLSTGSVVPAALPGMLSQVPNWLIQRDGPLRLRWRYAPRALPWLLRWIRASRRHQALRSGDAIAPLVRSSVEEYRKLLGPEAFSDLIAQRGQLLVSSGPVCPDANDVGQILRQRHGVPVDFVDAQAIRRLEPMLGRQYQAGMYVSDSAHTVNPERLTRTLAEAALREGAQNVSATASAFWVDGEKVVGVFTDKEPIEADVIVLAAGAHSRTLAAQIGDDIPLESERGYHVNFPDSGVSISRPIGNLDKKMFISPLDTGLRIAGTVEIAGLNAPADPRRSSALVRTATEMFPDMRHDSDNIDDWLGHRPSTPDSLPVISPASHYRNVIFAFGHGHVGLTAAPITGRLVSSLATGAPSPVPIEPYSVKRFAR